ncbi:MAG: trigger factor, partial [Syntrophales bacterium]|nr:trigger factor [Syntrophales bacterium]
MEEVAKGVTVEELSSVKKKLSFDIPWTDVKRELDSAYEQVAKKAKIKGFRPGKAPRRVLEVHYREDAEGEALTNLISKRYADAIRDNNLAVVAQPEIDQKGFEQDKNFSFTATVEIRPDVEPHDYEGLEVVKEEIEILDADVDARIDKLREMYSTLEPAGDDRAAGDGDFLVIDFDVTVDGVLREELTTKNYTVQIGGGSFMPGFEEPLKGLKKGEEKTIEITFPENYQPADLSGKQGVFKVTVNDVMEKKVPPLDEEFIKNFDAFERLEDLREAVRKSIVDENSARAETKLRNKIVDALLATHEFEVPSVWVDQQSYQLMLDTQRRIVANGLNSEKA